MKRNLQKAARYGTRLLMSFWIDDTTPDKTGPVGAVIVEEAVVLAVHAKIVMDILERKPRMSMLRGFVSNIEMPQ